MPGYDPELSITEMRAALLDRDSGFRELGDIMTRAAATAEGELWRDPRLREAAGLGAIVASATLAGAASPGGEATMLNGIGLFGLALVDSARDELRAAARA